MKRLLVIAAGLTASSVSMAGPFTSCPSDAYLIQGKPASVYSVDLVTGNNNLETASIGLGQSGFNAAGFSENDGYLYGYDSTGSRVLRMGSDFLASEVTVSNLPNYSFIAGDVYDDYLYFYNKTKGIFKINLAPLASNSSASLTMQTVKTYNSTKANHGDIAIHPNNGKIYGIDNNTGDLFEYLRSDGARTNLGDTGLGGNSFGALYFDGAGYLYAASNSSGNIYRVDLTDPTNITNVNGVFFANGPASGSNDGARCASADAVPTNSNIDFGDAPDTYSTTLASNGPRHDIDGVTYLGSISPDGDSGALTDDNAVGTADEDGIGFVAALDPGLSSVIEVTASSSGYLSAWFDWNRDGDFEDAGEQVFTDTLLNAGSNSLPFIVSQSATAGTSWSRFRFSQQTGLSYNGGSTSGEVEDHPITITANGYAVEYFPSVDDYASVAFEDNWPYTADYDMNDVIVDLQITETTLATHVEIIKISGKLVSYGATYQNGFAIRLPGITRSSIESTLTTLKFDGVEQPSNGLESISDEAIFIIGEDMGVHANNSSGCTFFRTETGCDTSASLFSFTLEVYFTEGSDRSSITGMPYDPFIFATPNTYHGEGLPFHPGRTWEVHLSGQAPTEQFDTSLYGIGVDASLNGSNNYFKTATYLPWALLIMEDWEWPLEYIDIVDAYPEFQAWAESGGVTDENWHQSPAAGKTYNLP